MTAATSDLQHPDHIWTWKESLRGRRQSIWLPYLQSISKKPKSNHWILAYNGGQVDADLSRIDSIMLYGGCGNLSAEFLDDLNQHRICLSIHRRNMPRPYLFLPASGADSDDLLTAQIVARSNLNDSAYVARTLIREKFRAGEWILPVSGADYKRLAGLRGVDEIRQFEAVHAAKYWDVFYAKAGVSPDKSVRRDVDSPVNTALDACSFFLHGILLRWALFHKFSPFHGFLHRPTGYSSLIYDLIEPYRHWVDRSVMEAAVQVGVEDEKKLTGTAIDLLKSELESPAYCPSTRQTVRRKSLLHGVVLAIRAWLLEKQTRLVIPCEGEKKGGRPPQVGFSIPGYRKDN